MINAIVVSFANWKHLYLHEESSSTCDTTTLIYSDITAGTGRKGFFFFK